MDEVTGVPISNEEKLEKELMGALKQQMDISSIQYEMLSKKLKELGESNMAEVMTPSMIMGGGNDGVLGGNGLIGGLILGSLLRNNGNFFGGDGVAGGAVLRNPPEQDQANMSLMQSIGQVDKAVAVGTAAMEASQGAQSAAIVAEIGSVTGSLSARVDSTKDAVNAGTMVLAQQLNGVEKSIMENRYELAKDIAQDGDKTRALLTAQYEAALNRQLSDANARVIALETRADTSAATRGLEITTTNNINQMQQQQQQQAQYGHLANLIWGLGQQIRSTNEAINVGSGTLTANPANTNTNIR